MITKVNKVANMKGMNYDGETRYKRVKDLFLGNVHVNNLVAVATGIFFFKKELLCCRFRYDKCLCRLHASTHYTGTASDSQNFGCPSNSYRRVLYSFSCLPSVGHWTRVDHSCLIWAQSRKSVI